jgi:hypothetical protein
MKLNFNKRAAFLIFCIFLLIIFIIYRSDQPKYDKDSYVPDKYTIIRDSHQTHITIGVEPSINKEGLLRTLTKAADENQSYSKRDYMLSSYLWVEAYLIDGNKQSEAPAGKLRRYVPPISGERENSLLDLFISIILPRKDSFTITIEEARLSMNNSRTTQ